MITSCSTRCQAANTQANTSSLLERKRISRRARSATTPAFQPKWTHSMSSWPTNPRASDPVRPRACSWTICHTCSKKCPVWVSSSSVNTAIHGEPVAIRAVGLPHATFTTAMVVRRRRANHSLTPEGRLPSVGRSVSATYDPIS